MALPNRPAQGFTLMELLVVLAIVAAFGILMAPYVTGTLASSQMVACLNNARCIQLVTISMATDGETKKDSSLGWPGDLNAAGRISNLSDFVTLLVRNGYVQANDLRIFSGPGYKPFKGTLTSGSNGMLVPPFTEENCAYKVYLVKKDDPANTLFLASKNYTYNMPLNTSPKLFLGKGFVVLRKGGDASFFKETHTQLLNLIGPLPGGGTVESAENCLNPGPAAP